MGVNLEAQNWSYHIVHCASKTEHRILYDLAFNIAIGIIIADRQTGPINKDKIAKLPQLAVLQF